MSKCKRLCGTWIPSSYVGKNTFITLFRVIPTLTYYSDIVSDILSGILSGIYSDILSNIRSGILSDYLKFILTFCLALSHSIWHMFWHSVWHSFWHSTWHMYTYVLIYSYIIYIYILALYSIRSDILSDMCSGPDVPRSIGSWRHGVRVLQRRRRGGEGKGRVAPLLKSRDPHLAGGEKWSGWPCFHIWPNKEARNKMFHI